MGQKTLEILLIWEDGTWTTKMVQIKDSWYYRYVVEPDFQDRLLMELRKHMLSKPEYRDVITAFLWSDDPECPDGSSNFPEEGMEKIEP